jgi:hypothetical protein
VTFALAASADEPGEALHQPASLVNVEELAEEFDTDYEEAGFWDEVLLTAFWDQPPAANAGSPNAAPRRVLRGTRSQLISNGSPIERLASTPHMFGDMLSLAGQVRVRDTSTAQSSALDLPLAGGTRRLKVSENNLPLPLDRVYYTYSHFSNALSASFSTPGATTRVSDSIDRSIVGVEKTYFGGWGSLEVRMPFTNGVNAGIPGGLTATTGSVGNLTLISKQLLLVRDRGAIAGGLGIELPTGDDVTGHDGSGQYRVANRATHLFPYIAALVVPNESMFLQGYVQMDAAASGNPVFLGPTTPSTKIGTLTEQNLLHFDLAGGAWLYSNVDAPVLTGLAAIMELHYVTTVSNPGGGEGADVIRGYTAGSNRQWQFGNSFGNVDILNLTAGLHTEIRRRTTVRVGCVVPLRPQPDRFFDSEMQVSVNHFW